MSTVPPTDQRQIGPVLFHIVLWVAVPFWGLAVVKGLLFNGPGEILALDGISFSVSFLILILWKSEKVRRQYLTNFYTLFWVGMFGFYWKYMDGLDGPFSYVFFTLMIFFVGVLENKARMIMVSLLVIVNVFLAMYGERFPLTEVAVRSTELINPMALNYIFNSIVIAVLVAYLKINFDIGRVFIHKRNLKLDHLNIELDEKRQTLISQKDMIIKIQNNLELLIKDRVQEQELRNQQLQAYAYHNTHLVRGPLTNILALVELMKYEELPEGVTHQKLDEIKRYANELDMVINKINVVLK